VALIWGGGQYYRTLETSQRGDLDITSWLDWFLQTLLRSLQQAQARIARVLAKAHFWQQHRQHALLPEQVQVLNRLLDANLLAQDPRGAFEHGISAGQYQVVAGVAKATATRHLADLVGKGCLVKMPGGGRSTRYRINWPA
jgi:Fic family protein